MGEPMPSDMMLARAEAAEDVAVAMMRAAGEAMTRHGDDPSGVEILASGFALAIGKIADVIDPRVRVIVATMLKEWAV
jgi:hypothetical protein